MVYLPPFSLTLVVGVIAMVFVVIRPREGFFLLLAALYYPLLPNIPFGSLEISITSILAFGLFLGALNLQRQDPFLRLARWQAALLAALAIVFLLSVLFSDSFDDSIRVAPNLISYWIVLYVAMVLVRSTEQLWLIARLILVLGFILSIWRDELAPLRIALHLPNLGLNGAVFVFHSPVAIALVTVIMLQKKFVSRFWRIFAWLALFSMIYHGLFYQTRAGWLVWIVMALVLVLQARWRERVILVAGAIGVFLMGLFLFANVISTNLAQTEVTVKAFVGATTYAPVSSDDLIRLVARDAGLRMFYARPVFGWGPDAYVRLKPEFLTYFGKESLLPGAFNSWLILLAEQGIVGTAVAAAVFLLPVLLSWKAIRKVRNPTTILAFGFALGVLGISIHLLFIDLMYSFAWAHAGLALASARLALDSN